jgi:hypothetical protein
MDRNPFEPKIECHREILYGTPGQSIAKRISRERVKIGLC